MQLLTTTGGFICVSSTETQSTNDYTLTFTHLDDSVSIEKVNTSTYKDRYLLFELDSADIELLTEGSGTVEVFHEDETSTIRTDKYYLISE